jgi:DNA-binding SARP family transcriptional activator
LAIARIYLTGRVAIEHGATLVEEGQLTGRQGRLAFVYLAAHRHSTVGRDELIDVIWPERPPAEIEVAFSAILSKLRGALKKAGLHERAVLGVRMGSVALRLAGDMWIDLEAAFNAIDEAEGAIRAGDDTRSWACANVGVSIARRPFLAPEEAPWIEAQRIRLRSLLGRGLYCLSVHSAAHGDPSLAVQYASEMIALEPFRETGYQQLMRLHARAGNRAEALRVFGQCRELLREELGASPSPQTEAVYLEILRA